MSLPEQQSAQVESPPEEKRILRRPSLLSILIASGMLWGFFPAAAQSSGMGLASLTEGEIKDHIHFLASDFLNGRKPGTEGYSLAAHYGAIHFSGAGLQPLPTRDGRSSSFLHHIDFESGDLSSSSNMVVETDGDRLVLNLGRDFSALQFPALGNTRLSGTPVFLGHGISRPDLGWDDYEGLDLSGRMAVIVGGAPTRHGAPFLGGFENRFYSNDSWSLSSRLATAVEHGVSALIVVVDSTSAPSWDWMTSAMEGPFLRPTNFGVVDDGRLASPIWIVAVKAQDAAEILAGIGGDPRSGESSYQPGQMAGVEISLDLGYEFQPAFSSPNVIGLLPGTDATLRSEYIVVSAHLDHLGVEGGEVFNGADDNASGSAAVLEAAEAASLAPPKRSILFVLFTAEEEGKLGSLFFSENPPVPLEDVVLQVNLDMVGRDTPSWPESLLVFGSEGFDSELHELIQVSNQSAEATLDWRYFEEVDPFGHLHRSDCHPFIQQGIPSILITRGFMNPDYHRASDDPEKINFPKVLQATRLAFSLAMEAANRESIFESPGFQ